jgi:DNA-binding NarL/FixJ family response regulator
VSRPEAPLEALPPLPPRQLEVLTLASKGYRAREIAVAMRISVRTVEAHLVRVRECWDVASTIEAAVMAAKRGLL